MNIQTITNCALILVGTIIMLMSIVKTKGLMKATPFVPKAHREQIKLYLVLHRCLMFFFVIGYVVVLWSFAFRYSLVSEAFVSTILFLGAVYVFLGIAIQSRLLAEIQQTLEGILPICMKCKKIRVADGNPENPKAWQIIEKYISERVNVDFSHGYCPKCLGEEMKRRDRRN